MGAKSTLHKEGARLSWFVSLEQYEFAQNASKFTGFANVKLVSSPLNFHLEQYEGPLDLLLDLIRKQQINIYDIPISRITGQYLEYMQRAAELDIEISSEFVFMSASLIHIKSRMLLPRDPDASD